MLLVGQGKCEPRKGFQFSNEKVIGDPDNNRFSGVMEWENLTGEDLRVGEELLETNWTEAPLFVVKMYFILKAHNSDSSLIQMNIVSTAIWISQILLEKSPFPMT